MSPTQALSTEQTKSTPPCRDQSFYFDDGDCIIQAEDHLFKIHRFLLKRNSQVFRDVFSLPHPPASPSEDTAVEGTCDDNPLVIQDPADDFRALCWALYAGPDDILDQQNSATVDLARMVKLLMISHKYEVKYLWDWSLRVIKDHLSLIPGKLISSCDGSWSETERLLILSSQCPDAMFISQRIEEEWFEKFQNSDFTEAREAFTAVLEVAERSPSLYHFHARAYHAYVKASVKPRKRYTPSLVDMNNTTTLVDLAAPDLNELRTSRLYRGFWSLSQLRVKLSVAPKIIDNPSCRKHYVICESAWVAWWEDNMQVDIHDPGELIRAMLDRAGSRGITQKPVFLHSSATTYVPCGTKICKQLEGMMKGFDDTLGDHFMLPRP